MGTVQLKPGESIEDWNDWESLILLTSLFPEDDVPKAVPPTGDVLSIVIFMLIAAVFGVALAARKKLKRFFII